MNMPKKVSRPSVEPQRSTWVNSTEKLLVPEQLGKKENEIELEAGRRM